MNDATPDPATYRIELVNVVRQIAVREAEIKPMIERLEELKQTRAYLESVEFITVNNIKRSDVEMSNDNPQFGTCWCFGEWLEKNSRKVWAEWNGRIYYTADLVNCRLPEMKGRTSELTN